MHHIIVGAVLIVEQLLHHRKNSLLETISGKLLAKICQPADAPLRVVLHLLDPAIHGGLNHGFFHQIGIHEADSFPSLLPERICEVQAGQNRV